MPRRMLVLALLVASASGVAAEDTALPVVPSAREVKPAAGPERKPVERKAAEVPKNSQGKPKTPPPLLDEKNLGLGCAQG